ncbi:MAG: hypothetical protein U9P10_09785 [Thermodesulfobacteriota bacterium]|nr:hypothetical protein [Thermodesulfobacteriota bacterium]
MAEAAKKNGIKGLIAYTSPQNKGMIRLFKKLPYKVNSEYEDDLLILNCLFSEPLETALPEKSETASSEKTDKTP